ncbi:MAG TPA: DUF4260 family protein [Acidobacteriaceae bacterium]|jgi:hypothetical protein|nr:DUF4260 family protein [Acidobacteriaceae bacterium]
MPTRPGVLLRLEGLLVLAAAVASYAAVLHGRWWIFAVFFLAPDVSLLGYLAKSPGAGAAALYNAIHSYALPIVLGLVSWRMGSLAGGEAALIWMAHIGFDRLLGFGLKYPEAFKPTHLQTVAVFRA